MNHRGKEGVTLWDEEDGFYYDVLHIHKTGYATPIRIRSMVGLIPLFAVATIESEILDALPALSGECSGLSITDPTLQAA